VGEKNKKDVLVKKINSDLNQVIQLVENNEFMLNKKKTKILLFFTKNKQCKEIPAVYW